MTNTGLVVRVWNDAAIARRDEDGYANATAMCQANGREWKAYHRIDRTQEYIQALAASLDLPAAELVITTTTGPNEFRGTWIHPRLAVDLARWISPEFAVWMDGWFLEQLEQQPQAPNLTAEDVARIAMDAIRAAAPAMPVIPAMPPGRHHSITSHDAIVSVMADLHSQGHAIVSRKTLLGEVARRYGYSCRTLDNTIPDLLNGNQLIRVRQGRFRLSALPVIPSSQLHQLAIPQQPSCLPDALHRMVLQCARENGGFITWQDIYDRIPDHAPREAWPRVANVIEAMQQLHDMGAGVFLPQLRTFRLAA
jgi:hypothetical protein